MAILDWLGLGGGNRDENDLIRREAAALYTTLWKEVRATPGAGLGTDHTTLLVAQRILAGSTPVMQVAIIEYWCLQICDIQAARDARTQFYVDRVLQQLLKRKLSVSPERVAAILDTCASIDSRYIFCLPLPALLVLVSKPPTQGEVAALRRLRDVLGGSESRQTRKIAERVDKMIAGAGGARRALVPQGTWSADVLRDIAAFEPATRDAWSSLVVHLLDSGSSEPSRKWETTLRQHLDAVGRAQFLDRALEWLALGPMPDSPADRQVPERDADYLKGFVWALGSFDDANVARALADMGAQCFRKVPNLGPISARVGNACVRTLGRLKGHEPVAQLGRLRTRVKYVVGLQLIGKALAAAAAREGIDPEELEELAVPTFDLDASGALTREIGGHLAEIRIAGSDAVVLSWKTSAGRPQKSVPAIVRASQPAELARLKKTIKDITAILPAQRARLERLMESDRAIPLHVWRQRYVEHPVLGHMARRLIWRFADGERRAVGALLPGVTGPPLSRDGVGSRVVDPIDRDIPWLSASTTVHLWHPLGDTPDVVLEWRRWLDRHGVVQPFKQAHREIYILTDAERATRVYSNRFAAHVLRQHQFAALCRERGWQYRLQGNFDGANTPNRTLPHWQLGVEFLVNAPTDHTAAVAGSGIYQYVFTDQVSFYRNGDASGTRSGRTRVPLDEVPALAFSEVMRDLDLFVSVCSIGNDPMWGDQGVPEYVDYWRTFSLNELSESAKMRRTVLEGLIPRLKIADRLKLEDPFLVVRGDLATYKIHLGSTNVLMEPGSRYLCIVPARNHFTASRSDVWLPFEGDGALAIIVSKALLLTADKTITDPVILAQLRRR